MVSLEKGKSYRIVGVGVMCGDDICVVSGNSASGYIELEEEMIPVNLSLFGKGVIGEFVTFLGI